MGKTHEAEAEKQLAKKAYGCRYAKMS